MPIAGMRDVRALDGVSFEDWFVSHGGSKESVKRMWDPIGEQGLAVHAPLVPHFGAQTRAACMYIMAIQAVHRLHTDQAV